MTHNPDPERWLFRRPLPVDVARGGERTYASEWLRSPDGGTTTTCAHAHAFASEAGALCARALFSDGSDYVAEALPPEPPHTGWVIYSPRHDRWFRPHA